MNFEIEKQNYSDGIYHSIKFISKNQNKEIRIYNEGNYIINNIVINDVNLVHHFIYTKGILVFEEK